MSQTIYLVRHGQDQDNAQNILNGHRDTELTELGRQQAAAVGDKLKDNKIDIIYSSPLKRACQTARIIAEKIGLDEIVIDQHLIERDFGILTGKPIADIKKFAKNTLQTDKVLYFLEAEGAEGFSSLYQRAEIILRELQQRHPDKNLLIVTHGDMGKMIRSVFHGWSWEKGLRQPYFDNTAILELAKEGDIVE